MKNNHGLDNNACLRVGRVPDEICLSNRNDHVFHYIMKEGTFGVYILDRELNFSPMQSLCLPHLESVSFVSFACHVRALSYHRNRKSLFLSKEVYAKLF